MVKEPLLFYHDDVWISLWLELRKVKIARLQAPDGHSVYRTDKTAADQLHFFSRRTRRRLGFQEGRQLHTQSGILERENLNRELYHLTARGDGVKEQRVQVKRG